MITPNKRLVAIAIGLAISAFASPSFAQRSEDHMSAAREQALRECNLAAQKYTQHTWADVQIQTIGPAWPSMANRSNVTSR